MTHRKNGLTNLEVPFNLRNQIQNEFVYHVMLILHPYQKIINIVDLAFTIKINTKAKFSYMEYQEIEQSKIKKRLYERFDEGMIKEVESLIDRGLSHERLQYFGLEYKIIGEYLLNNLEFNEMRDKLNYAINRFSKRQMTFFRRMEKRGININWINPEDINKKEEFLRLFK